MATERYFNIAGQWTDKIYSRDVDFVIKAIHVIGL